jgi:hypothetical protein
MNVRVTGIRIVAALAAVALLQSAAPAQPSATASAPGRRRHPGRDIYDDRARVLLRRVSGVAVRRDVHRRTRIRCVARRRSVAAYARHLARDARVLQQLRALDGTQLSSGVTLDRTLIENNILDDELLTGELAQWRHNPDIYVGLASGSIYSLIERNFAPVATRLADTVARENQIPRMLAQARANLGSVDAATKTVSALDAKGAASFLTDDVTAAFAGAGSARSQAAFRASTARAKRAMLAFVAYIDAIRPAGTYAIGTPAYERRLRYEDALPIPVPQYLAIGRAALLRDRARFIATAHLIDPKAPVRQTYAALAHKHPAPGGLLAAAAGDLAKLRTFIVTQHIVTVPADADISVVPTPKFERSFVTAQEDAPGVLESSRRKPTTT